MLQYQFAARYNFNKAEKINSALWIISIMTALVAFIPTLEDASWFVPVPIFIDFIVIILCFVCNNAVKNAADIRAIFDDYVLGLNSLNISKERKSQINEIVRKTIKIHHTEAQIQMNNTGNDTPPGVKDWYEFPDEIDIQSPILFCQRQNIWWTNKMMFIKCALFLIEAIILIVFVSIIVFLSDITSFEKAICIVGFMIKTIDRVFNIIRYCICCLKTIGAIEVQDRNCSKDTLVKIQERIDNMRAIPILGKNKCHQKLANKLSKCFKETIEE